DAGLHVEQSSPPCLEEVYPISRDYWRRPESESPDEWVKGSVADPRGLGPMTGEDVERSLFEWDRFRRRMLPFIAEYPLVLSPAGVRPAVRHGDDDGGIPYTLTWSLVGYPAVVVRAGTSAEGMPIGIQITAAPWREDLALAAAAVVEAALGGWSPPSIGVGIVHPLGGLSTRAMTSNTTLKRSLSVPSGRAHNPQPPA